MKVAVKKKILLVEDDAMLRDSLVTALSSANYVVFEAKNGKLGLEQAITIQPNLIICDIMMPEYDGYWLLENIRKSKNLMSIPFIFISAKAEREDLRKGMTLGADDYLTKPFRISELLDAVESRFSKRKEILSSHAPADYKPAPIDTENYFVVDTGHTLEKIKTNSIELITAENVYSKVHMIDGKVVIVRKSLNAWEKILPGALFVRIHRATIVNLEYVKQIEKWFNQTLQIQMTNFREPLLVSRGYYKKLKSKFII